jgi:hypothetical protein
MNERRRRGRRPGDGAYFPGGDRSRLDQGIAYFLAKGGPVIQRAVARHLGMTARTIQRLLHGTPWPAYVAIVAERWNDGWRP